MEGEAFFVECPLDDTVTWHFAETDISTDNGERVHSSGMKLWFLPTAPQDSGNYTCKQQAAPYETETVSVTILPYKEGKCYYKDALYIESRGSPGSGKISCPTFSDYENASDVKWYKVCMIKTDSTLLGDYWWVNRFWLGCLYSTKSKNGNEVS
ncbi:hypothetical protein lerEdw1_016598 [Lerista edwardsae]|nr:hypothetical protein lerEdw1_016598 [Lerista edwardsae]